MVLTGCHQDRGHCNRGGNGGDSSSEAETGEDEPEEVQGNPDDFFAGLS